FRRVLFRSKGKWTTLSKTITSKDNREGFAGLLSDNIFSPDFTPWIEYKDLKAEKGNKATDWTPAPEDTDAKIDHIETEWTQTFDTFSQTVAGIDGRVTSQKQTIDSITQTVTDHTGKIATVEQNVHGIQQTVSDPVNGLITQVSTLANGLNVLVKDFEDLEVGGRNWVVRANELDGMWIDTAGDVTNGINTAVMRDYIQVEPG